MEIIRFENVKFKYNAGHIDEVKAVDGISFSVKEGEFLALCGHNGSGKSTLAKLMNGLEVPSSGNVYIGGMDINEETKLTASEKVGQVMLAPLLMLGGELPRLNTKIKKNLFEIRKTVGVVFQNPDNQMVATIIEDDVAFGPENLGLKPKEIRQRVDWALESVGMLEYKEGAPFRLSGGQKQRIAIAGVLAIKPKVIVLDESTSMLDPSGRQEVLDVIKRLNKEEGMTVIMITHFMEEAAMCDRVIVLKEGKILLDGGREIFKETEKIREAGLELPIAARVAFRLKEKGMDIKDGIVEIGELVERL
ncbi:MAG: energy-coupling factor transporter ATPase [Firmicutes bacterium]|nr:energy-coupling factor transporter ATPase [Bacillota bacterium]